MAVAGINGDQGSTRFHRLLKKSLEDLFLVTVLVRMLFPNERIGSCGVKSVKILSAKRPKFEEFAFQKRLEIKGHASFCRQIALSSFIRGNSRVMVLKELPFKMGWRSKDILDSETPLLFSFAGIWLRGFLPIARFYAVKTRSKRANGFLLLDHDSATRLHGMDVIRGVARPRTGRQDGCHRLDCRGR
jgi:hypothetical protein